MNRILNFYRISNPIDVLSESIEEKQKYYKKLRWSTFLAATIGYSLYYVCRTSVNIVKKPILESGLLDAHQLGIIGSVLLFSYAIGKFVNGFLADYCNIKRFMATGLLISGVANFVIGTIGLSKSMMGISSFVFFVCFAIIWGINGWSQSMGAAPAIISLSRWFPLRERGTFYGLFSASHNLGEFFSFLFVGLIVNIAGWQWGFLGSSIAGFIGFMIICIFLHDTPESKGLPAIEVLSNESFTAQTVHRSDRASTSEVQRAVLKNFSVWLLAAASAFMYITRYAINGWGVLFLQEVKGFSMIKATQIISINALLGIIGTIFSGWISDHLFMGNRNKPALFFGLINTISLFLFLYSDDNIYVNIISMILFGTAIGVQICFLGGLMAVDLVPRNASGAALGIVGIASYIGAGLQDVFSGWLIETGKTTINGIERYSFSKVGLFWIVASIISLILVLLIAGRAKRVNNDL
ncbi:MAG: MFS transporter [Bacteroides sp.]|nr:MFS transporter [Bacteroides sp.]